MFTRTKKFMPSLPGRDAFKGEVVHSSHLRSANQVENQHVVVVGGGKSAVDCAVAASKAPGTTVTFATRTPHWATPRKIFDLIPFEYIFLSRFGQALVVGFMGPVPGLKSWRICHAVCHALGWFVSALIFKMFEFVFALQYHNMCGATAQLGKVSLVSDFYGQSQILNYDLRDQVRAGKVKWLCGSGPTAFTKDGIKIGDQEVRADVVIFATGFHKDYDVFPRTVQSKLQIELDGLYLWRHTIPVNVPNLAFVGSELAGISNISLYGVQAAWVAKYWSGRMEVPSPEEMQEEIEATKAWKRRWMPES